MCSDPGRPADGTQIATSYEIGKTVTFTCNRHGFVPEPSSLTCESKDKGAKATWNDTLPIRCVGKFFSSRSTIASYIRCHIPSTLLEPVGHC